MLLGRREGGPAFNFETASLHSQLGVMAKRPAAAMKRPAAADAPAKRPAVKGAEAGPQDGLPEDASPSVFEESPTGTPQFPGAQF